MANQVTFTVIGGGPTIKVDHVPDRTVREYLDELEIEPDDGQSVSVDGEKVQDLGVVVTEGANVMVASQTANG